MAAVDCEEDRWLDIGVKMRLKRGRGKGGGKRGTNRRRREIQRTRGGC